MSKPWNHRVFLDGNRNTNRTYPPKDAFPWRYSTYPGMEYVVDDGMLPSGPVVLGLPEPTDDCYTLCIASCEDNAECESACEDVCKDNPNVCGGNRVLWVQVQPGPVDCSTDKAFNLIVSPDFQCVDLQQVLASPNSPTLSPDSKELETNCESDPEDKIFIAVCDCECGGCTIVGLPVENCNVVCGDAFISCDADKEEFPIPDECSDIVPAQTKQYYLHNNSSDVFWSSSDESVFTVDQNGLVTTVGDPCEGALLRAATECCEDQTLALSIECPVGDTDCGFWEQDSFEVDTCGRCTSSGCTYNVEVIFGAGRTIYGYACEQPSGNCSGCLDDTRVVDACVGSTCGARTDGYLQSREHFQWKCL